MPPSISTTSPTDGQLLGAFAQRRDEAAFAQLVERHGAMVRAACRAMLKPEAAVSADDAAQAVFVALALKAPRLLNHPTLAGWLHRAARCVCAEARRSESRRHLREQEAARMRAIITSSSQAVDPSEIHDALDALPEKYRVPLILHHMEGLTEQQTADMLGLGLSAISSRLERGREKLRARLARTGAVVSAAGIGLMLAPPSSAASTAFVAAATESALAAIGPTAALTASTPILAMAKGAIHMLFMAKLKLAAMVTAAVVLVGGAGVGTVLVAAAPQGVQPGGQPPARPVPRTPPVAATPGGIVFTGHTSPVTHVSASADASVLVSSGLEDGTIRVWDVASRRCVRTIPWRNANLGYVFGQPTIRVPPGWTPVMAISPDGKWIAAAEQATGAERKAGKPDAWLRLIEVATGKDVHRIEVRNQPNVRLQPRYVAALAFSPDSKQLAVSTWAGSQGDPTIDLWDVASGKHVRLVTRLNQGARCVVFSPDGQRLAFTNGRVPGGLALGKPDDLLQYESHGSPGAMVFSRDSTKLLGVDANGGKLVIWDAATGKLQQSGAIVGLNGDASGQRRLNLGATGLDLLVPGTFGARVLDLRGAGGLAHEFHLSTKAPDHNNRAPNLVNDVLLHPDGKRAILACGDWSVRIESLCPNAVKATMDAGELAKAWAALGGDDAEKAYRATWALALSGERAVKAMAARLDEAANVGQRFAGLIKQLNDNDSQARDAAEQKLAQTDLAGAAAMLAALDTLPQVPREPRDRIARVLPPIELRWRRAVRALELTGIAESRQLLARIAKAHPFATVKQDAAAVLSAAK